MKNPLLQPVTSVCRLLSLLMLATTLLLLSTGCSSFKKIGRDITGSGGELKKKVGLTLFENRTALASKDLRENFDRPLIATMAGGCSNILLVTPEDKKYLDYLTQLPRLSNGLVDNYALAASGRKYGFNAVVSGSLLDIRIEEEASGFWLFRSSSPTIELLVGAQVYDTETGAKILDRPFSRKITISEAEFESLRAGGSGMLSVLSDSLQQIADDVGESICDAVNRQPWKGYIISVPDDKVILSSGKATGLIPGDVLEVYDSTQTISGYEGQRFFVPGLKIGEIRITAVYPNRSEAVVLSGKDIREGCSVKRR